MAMTRRKELLIDGYNVLRSGSRYKALSGYDYTDDAFNHKREALLNDVATYAGHEYKATVVFDGARNNRSAGDVEMFGGVRIIFSPHGSSADKVIEKLAAQARERGVEVLVVSSDARIQETVFTGSVTRMSAEGFCRELAGTYEENHVTITPRPAKKMTLGRRLDASTVEQLRALRDELQGGGKVKWR